MFDDELARAGGHLTFLVSVLDGIYGLIERVHLAAASGLIYKAWPQLHADVDKLIVDVRNLIMTIRALG